MIWRCARRIALGGSLLAALLLAPVSAEECESCPTSKAACRLAPCAESAQACHTGATATDHVYYIIQSTSCQGDYVMRLPAKGETVLDALKHLGGFAMHGSKQIWVARPCTEGDDEIMPVNCEAISQGGCATNYELKSGDRLFVVQAGASVEHAAFAENFARKCESDKVRQVAGECEVTKLLKGSCPDGACKAAKTCDTACAKSECDKSEACATACKAGKCTKAEGVAVACEKSCDKVACEKGACDKSEACATACQAGKCEKAVACQNSACEKTACEKSTCDSGKCAKPMTVSEWMASKCVVANCDSTEATACSSAKANCCCDGSSDTCDANCKCANAKTHATACEEKCTRDTEVTAHPVLELADKLAPSPEGVYCPGLVVDGCNAPTDCEITERRAQLVEVLRELEQCDATEAPAPAPEEIGAGEPLAHPFQADALRQTSSALEHAAAHLEEAQLYDQADQVRRMAEQLRHDSRQAAAQYREGYFMSAIPADHE